MANKKFDRRILFEYLMNKYEVTSFPKTFYMKLSNIFNGKLSTIAKPIPPEDLYDMWILKEDYLNKVYIQNIARGKNFKDGYLRCNYDLSILISKYDSYLKWKSRQDTLKEDEQKNIKNVTTTNVLYTNKLPKQNNNDISDIIDELI